MQVADITRLTGGTLTRGDPSTRISSISYDSRSIRHGALFVALRGGYVDGHEFVHAASQAGAVAAMVESGTAAEPLSGFDAVVEVADTRAALAQVAAEFFRQPSSEMTVIGVTGTDGKTTTSYFIEAICRAAGLSTGMIGTVEVRTGAKADLHSSRQTTPESLHVQQYLDEMRDNGVNTAIIEATSHGLVLHRLDHCAFDVGVVTNITHEHLDFHGTVEQYRLAKGRLLQYVSEAQRNGKRGAIATNLDDDGARSITRLADGCRVVGFSPTGNPQAEVRATRPSLWAHGSTFDLVAGKRSTTVTIQLPGGHNIANAVAAAAAGLALDIDIVTIARGLSSLPSVPGRMERVVEGQPFTVLVDYAHSPEAIRGILSEAHRIATGRVLVLFGSAGERDIEKRALQGAIAAELADFSVFTSEDPRFEDPMAIVEAIAAGATEAGAQRGVDFECIEDRAKAILRILEQSQPGDVVVLAGKGHERSMIYGSDFRPWNEAEAARRALHTLGYRAGAERRTAVS